MALVMTISVWPTITGLLWLLWPVLQNLPLPGRTLVLTLVMVPLMTWIVVPCVTRAVTRWLG
jgi:antibiotic biosynthesis monooxygenase (ABM) superfamily enzyme